MSHVTIRRYLASDLAACQGLWVELVQCHRDLYSDPSVGGSDPGLAFNRHLGRVGPDLIWVAEDCSRIVGLTALVVDGDEAEVEPLVVTADHRGRGTGRALLSQAADEARGRAIRYLTVRPVARNYDAIAFFHRAGFRLLGRLELFMELRPGKDSAWQAGPQLFGMKFGL